MPRTAKGLGGLVSDLIDTTEMYLRTVLELEEEGIPPLRARIAERLEHSGPTVSQTVARMERDGLLTLARDRRIELTDEGRLRAVRVMRKHRLAERMLIEILGLELEYVHAEACRWEHVMSERVERRLLTIFGDQQLSPYGNPIPGLGEIGGNNTTVKFRDGLATLEEMAEEDQDIPAVVRRIGEAAQTDVESLAVMMAVGIVPGQDILVRLEGERVLAQIAGGAPSDAVTLPMDVARHVFVETKEDL